MHSSFVVVGRLRVRVFRPGYPLPATENNDTPAADTGAPFDMPRHRPSPDKRGYGAQWERAAAHYRAHHPWCLGCEAIGLQRRSQIVDHIIPHCGDTNLFWSQSNWQPCCKWHHDAVKQSLELRYRLGQCNAADLVLTSPVAVQLARSRHKPAIGADGFAIDGT